jgi:uncharacterized membrane protein YraQ (UPF0718 family)
LNPVVFAATYMAFRSRPELAYSRMGMAFLVAFCIGIIIYRFFKKNPLRGISPSAPINQFTPIVDNSIQTNIQAHTYVSSSTHQHNQSTGSGNKLFSILGHASDEFFEMGKYLIFGAILTACIQTLVSRESLISIGQGEYSSHLFMMGFAYVLSLCSTSDAFVASSFAATFTAGSLLTFLVFGPMIDLKNTLMLLSVFRARFVLLLTFWVVVLVLACSLVFDKFIF